MSEAVRSVAEFKDDEAQSVGYEVDKETGGVRLFREVPISEDEFLVMQGVDPLQTQERQREYQMNQQNEMLMAEIRDIRQLLEAEREEHKAQMDALRNEHRAQMDELRQEIGRLTALIPQVPAEKAAGRPAEETPVEERLDRLAEEWEVLDEERQSAVADRPETAVPATEVRAEITEEPGGSTIIREETPEDIPPVSETENSQSKPGWWDRIRGAFYGGSTRVITYREKREVLDDGTVVVSREEESGSGGYLYAAIGATAILGMIYLKLKGHDLFPDNDIGSNGDTGDGGVSPSVEDIRNGAPGQHIEFYDPNPNSGVSRSAVELPKELKLQRNGLGQESIVETATSRKIPIAEQDREGDLTLDVRNKLKSWGYDVRQGSLGNRRMSIIYRS